MASINPVTKDLEFCKVQSMQLPEQLGDVDHIFCDKTGTLTQNELEVKALSVNGEEVMAGSGEELKTKLLSCDMDAVK